MLGRRRNDVADACALGCETGDRQVVCLGCTASKDDLVSARADARGYPLPRMRSSVGCGASRTVLDTRRVPELGRQVGHHFLEDSGIHGRGGLIIEINHWLGDARLSASARIAD